MEKQNSIYEIASAQNKTFKLFKSLLTKKYRELENCFLMEGQRYIETSINSGAPIQSVIVSDVFWNAQNDAIKSYYLNVTPVYLLKENLFNELVQTEQSQGIIGVYPIKQEGAEDHYGQNILFLDRIQDPGNMGTIIRTADAAGFRHILCAKGSVDPYNPKVVRSTAGSILNVHLQEIDHIEEEILSLKELGYRMVVTALEHSTDYDDNSNYGKKNCLIIGNEANGVSDSLLKLADCRVKIPIVGQAESLNASVAAGIMMYKIHSVSVNLRL